MISVLYVDDEAGLLEISKFFLEQDPDFSVDTAISVPEALRLMQARKYDIILSDYMMPDINGITFLKDLKASSSSLPFIIFTGRGREEVVIEALNYGADFYIQKGGDPEAQFAELSNKIRHAVSRRRYEEELGISEILEQEMKFHEKELINYITEIKQMERAIKAANRKLNLLNNIIRHDILNTITGLLGLEDMALTHCPDDDLSRLLYEIKDNTRRIQQQITFTRDYQDIGVNEPQWQNIHHVIASAAGQTNLGPVRVEVLPDDGLEIFADAMLVKVFYNLIDNALRYGKNLTTISFSSRNGGNTVSIICEDDGGGVACNEKDRIFESGFGKNTGQGLYLTREILNISGISITENGTHGNGARFELTAPDGTWRYTTTKPEA